MSENQQQIRKATPEEDIRELFSRTAKLNDAMSALLDPRWGANVGILPKDHPLYPKMLEPLPGTFGHKASEQEQATPVDWQDIAKRRERELKQVGEARRRAEAAIARVRRLCDMTIAESVRTDAIHQARDTLAALDRSADTPADIPADKNGPTIANAQVDGGEVVDNEADIAHDLTAALRERRPTQSAPCRTTQHCAHHGWCRRCAPVFAATMSRVNVAIQRTDPDASHWGPLYEAIGKTLNNGEQSPRTTADNSPTSSDTQDNSALHGLIRQALHDADDHSCQEQDGVDYDRLTAAALDTIRPLGKFLGDMHRDAEADLARVIDLHERWVKTGAPPLGTSINRWWDRRLIELRHAIVAEPASDGGPTVREAAADDRRWPLQKEGE